MYRVSPIHAPFGSNSWKYTTGHILPHQDNTRSRQEAVANGGGNTANAKKTACTWNNEVGCRTNRVLPYGHEEVAGGSARIGL
jgi:hypothetical protein